MTRRSYYCLIAGLPDILQDDKKLHFSSLRIRDYLKETLHPGDFALVELFYLPYDNQNLLNRMFRKEKPFDERGNLTEEQLDCLLLPKLFEEAKQEDYPVYLFDFGRMLREREEVEEKVTPAAASRMLTEGYYNMLSGVGNPFVRETGEWLLNSGNLLLALNGRKHNLAYEDTVIGNNLVAQAVKKNRTRDFGLVVDYPEIEPLLQLFETENLLEREFRLDTRQWSYLDDATFFHYFSIERVLAFVLKVFLAERWYHLDYEKGQVMFNQLLNDIESSFEFPEEFSHTYGKKR